MSKVLVDRELLERCVELLDLLPESRTIVGVRAILAQPAEAEGVDFGFDDRSVKVSQEAYSIFLEREQHHLAALSAVTAERDRLQKKWARVESERDKLRAAVTALRSDALIGTDAYRATVYVLRRAACDEVFGVAKLQRIFLLDWHSAERLLKEMFRRGDVVLCAGHGWKFPDAAMAAKEA